MTNTNTWLSAQVGPRKKGVGVQVTLGEKVVLYFGNIFDVKKRHAVSPSLPRSVFFSYHKKHI